LRDLAGLIVVDFIDMEEGRNNRAVERRMKDALKNDRARIQVGRISHFGLLEMSRQRIRTGVLEGSTVVCPHCAGAGVVRSTASVALHVLRVLEDALIKSATHDMTVRARTPVALYILNQKRAHLRDLERRFGVAILVEADDTLTGVNLHAIERGEPASGSAKADEPAEGRPAGYGAAPAGGEDFLVEEEPEAAEESEPAEEEATGEEFEGEAERGESGEPAAAGDGEPGRRRRRRRRRRGGERSAGEAPSAEAPQPTDVGLEAMAEIGGDFAAPVHSEGEAGGEDDRGSSSRRRRGRRGRRGGSGGERERFGARAPGSEAVTGSAESEADAEPNLFDAPPRERAEPESEGSPTSPIAAAWPGETAAPVEPEAERAEPPAQAPQPAQAAQPTQAAQPPATEPVAEAEEPAAAPAAPEPAADDPSRPRRSGWWQRAKATLSGE
jgi:ribonuclease E